MVNLHIVSILMQKAIQKTRIAMGMEYLILMIFGKLIPFGVRITPPIYDIKH